MIRFRRIGQARSDDIRFRQVFIEMGHIPHFVGFRRYGTLTAAQADDVSPHGLDALAEVAADIAKTDDDDCRAVEGCDRPFVVPQGLMLIVIVKIEFLHHSQCLGQHVFRQGQAIGTGRIGQGDAGRQDTGLAVFVGTGTVELEPLQLRGLLHQVRSDIANDDVRFIQRLAGLGPITGTIAKIRFRSSCFQPLFLFCIDIHDN